MAVRERGTRSADRADPPVAGTAVELRPEARPGADAQEVVDRPVRRDEPARHESPVTGPGASPDLDSTTGERGVEPGKEGDVSGRGEDDAPRREAGHPTVHPGRDRI